MLKSEVKGHGTIKKLRTGAVVSVLALGVAGVGGVVSADEVGASEITSVAEAPISDGVGSPVVETVTAEQVATAKVVATEANKAVTAQEGVVASAEQAVTANDASITDLNNQIQEVNAVTPEVVASAEASLADATNKVETQKGVVASAEADKTASAVADAESDVDALSSSTDTTALEQNVSNLTTKVASDKGAVSSAKLALELAKDGTVLKKEQDEAKVAVEEAKSNLETTEVEATDKSSNLSSAQASLTTAQSNKKNADSKVSSSQSALNVANSDFANLMASTPAPQNMSYFNQADPRWRSMYFGISTMGLTGCVPASVANVITSLTGRTVLPTEVASYLYNNTNEFNKAWVGASSTGVYSALRNWGLTPTNLSSVSEVETALKQGHTLLVAVEKDKFTPYGGTHELVLKGYSNGSTYAYDPYTRANIGWYPVRSLWAEQSTDPMDNKGLVSTFIKVTTNAMNQKETAIKTAQASLNQAKSAQTVAANALSQAQASYSTALSSYNEAQTTVSEAKAQLQNAENNLASLMSSSVDLSSYEQALSSAQATLAQDEQSLQTAKETLALAKASAVDKAKALEDAKAELAEAIKANESAQGVLAQENETLEVLRKAVDVAKLALAEAEPNQTVAQATFDTASAKASGLATQLANKDSILAELNSQLAEATAKAETLRAELETAKELLETLKADANAKNVEYLRLLGLKAEQDEAEAEVGTNQVVNIKNISSQTNQPVHNKAITAKITQNIVSRHQAGKTSYQASLPETGDESSLFGIMGVSLLLGLGFVGKRRKV